MDNGELEEAIFEFSAALKINSNYGRARKNLDAAKEAVACAAETSTVTTANMTDERAESSSTAGDPVPAATEDPEAEHLQEKAKGNQAFAKGDMKGAVAAYTKAIQVHVIIVPFKVAFMFPN